MRSLVCLLGLSFVMLVVALPIGAQEAPTTPEPLGDLVDCVDPEFLSNALIECESASAASLESDREAVATELDASMTATSGVVTTTEEVLVPSYCRQKVDAIFWGARQWFELAQGLDKDLSQCAEYYITIPPQDDNRRNLRADGRFNEVRLVDPRIHPIAEIRFTDPVRLDWRDLALSNGGDLEDFYNAGVLARTRMAQGSPPRINIGTGETWAFNEFTKEVLEDVPGWRDQVLAFLRGLYDGPPGAPKAKGIVFNLVQPSTTQDPASYKAALQEFLQDEAFWRELGTYVDFFAQEAYVDVHNWGVPGVPHALRAATMNDYFHHVTELAEAGPETVEAARSFLRRTYVPLGSAGWPSALVGNTELIPADTMGRFVSAQVYAFRHYANANPQGAPQGRIGFGWAPIAEHPRYSPGGTDLILARLASAIHASSEEGTNSQMGACGLPGAPVWCMGDVEGAALNDAWAAFGFWSS
jgi:hypothetical protein